MMDTKDKVLLIGSVFAGGFIAGLSGANSLGLIAGGLAGLGALCVAYMIFDKIDEVLAVHYTKKGRF
jgi:hypothetical protein